MGTSRSTWPRSRSSPIPVPVSVLATLRIRNFETGSITTPETKDATGKVLQQKSRSAGRPSKVNDRDGNPIEISAVVVWKVVNTAEAMFEVDDYEDYVAVQSEASVRSLASRHPYDEGHHDEVVTTLLLNFIVLLFVSMLLEGPLKDPMGLGWPQSERVIAQAQWPRLIQGKRLHMGFVVAILAALGVWLMLARSVFGYEMRAVGHNAAAARFAGIPVNRVLALTALLSGGLAALAGVSEVSGLKGSLSLDLSPGYGYTGIVVAMLALLHPLGVGSDDPESFSLVWRANGIRSDTTPLRIEPHRVKIGKDSFKSSSNEHW